MTSIARVNNKQMNKEEVFNELTKNLVYNQYRDTYVIKGENLPFLAEGLAKLSLQKEVKIELTEYCHDCGDGCCTNYGTTKKVNGIQLKSHNQDTETILKEVLEHLGYTVEIQHNYE